MVVCVWGRGGELDKIKRMKPRREEKKDRRRTIIRSEGKPYIPIDGENRTEVARARKEERGKIERDVRTRAGLEQRTWVHNTKREGGQPD